MLEARPARRPVQKTARQRRRETVARNLRAARHARGLSQEALAAEVYTRREHLVRWEAATWEPNVEAIERLAAALGVAGHFFYIEDAAQAALMLEEELGL